MTTINNHFIDNQNVVIHCIEINKSNTGIPIIIIPGATNSAEELQEDLKDKLNHWHIIVSLRGRGKSGSPDKGYSLDDHATDITAVIDFLGIGHYYLFGHSIGSTVGIRVAKLRPERVKGLILGDFPPFFPPFDKSWADRVLQNPNIAISKAALYGLAKEGRYTDVSKDFAYISCPILLIRGGKKDSAFPGEQVPAFKKIAPNCQVQTLDESGHDIFRPEPEPLIDIILHFLNRI
ncbi:MAG: alpha/beta hydrolase [Sphingobacteriales bacterium]|nr:alpha/beta hydrolase [Sphingobacteriales bacterium]